MTADRLMTALALLLAALCLATYSHRASAQACTVERDAKGKITRSTAALAQFQKQNPCPATHQTTGACPGYVIDHIVPRCACGPDTPDNMQWQARLESLRKDRAEKAYCRWQERARARQRWPPREV